MTDVVRPREGFPATAHGAEAASSAIAAIVPRISRRGAFILAPPGSSRPARPFCPLEEERQPGNFLAFPDDLRGVRVSLWPAVALAAVVLGVTSACGDGGSPSYAGIVRDPAPVVDGEPLPDAARGGEAFPFRADPGGLLVAYFGYMHCPDVCPTTMADLRGALGELPAGDAGRVRVAMVTVDPDRDTGEALTRYVHTFFPAGHALRTADAGLLRRVADRFGATYGVTTAADGRIEVSHTAFLYAVDSGGRLLLQWPFRTEPKVLSDDLRALLDAVAEEA